MREASKRVLGLRPFDVQLIGISLEASLSLTNFFVQYGVLQFLNLQAYKENGMALRML